MIIIYNENIYRENIFSIVSSIVVNERYTRADGIIRFFATVSVVYS